MTTKTSAPASSDINQEEEGANLPAKQEHGTQIAKASDTKQLFQPVNMNVDPSQLPDLSLAKTLPFDLMSDYWTPEKEGEFLNVFFSHIENADYPNKDTGEVKTLPTAFFIEQRKTAEGIDLVMRCNASARLVGRLQSHQGNGTISHGSPLRITYLGKVKNSTNAYYSADWSVKPMVVDITEPAK